MNYYDNALNWYNSAKFSLTGEFYQQSISQSCLAVELFLKSKLILVDPDSELDKSHDSISIFKELAKKYPTRKELLHGIRNCRKYFNEARYPHSGTDIYTKEFAEEFVKYVEDVRDYIDNECPTSMQDLQNKYGHTKVINSDPYK